MPMDNRDWYVNLIRKRTGYVERSKFRAPANSETPRKVRLHLTWRILLWALVLVAIGLIAKYA